MSLDSAEALLAVGRVDEARQRVIAVLIEEPENVEALCLLAQCHQEAGDYGEMLRAAEDALRAGPDEFLAHLLHSQALLQLDRYDEAVESGATSVRLAPESPAAYVAYGCALFAANQRRRGWAAMREAARLAPEWPTVHFVIGAIWHSYGSSRRARQAYERTLRLQPDHEGARQGLGQLAMTSGRLGKAISHLGSVAGSPSAEAAGPGVDRALRGLTGNALVIAWLVGLILVFGQLPLAWAVAAVPVAVYAIWILRVIRSLPPNVAAGVRLRLETDPRLRWRIGLAAVTLVLGVAIGAYQLLNPVSDTDPRLLAFLVAMIGWLLLSAIVVLSVDHREARRLRPKPGSGTPDPAVAELAVTELVELETAGLARRWLTVTGIVVLVPCVLAVEPASPWGQRAVVGALTIGLLCGYYALSRRRWSRPGARRRTAPPWALPLVRMAYLALGSMWLGLLVIAFWPGQPPEIALAWLFVAISGAVIAAVVSGLVSAISRLTRRRSTVDGE